MDPKKKQRCSDPWAKASFSNELLDFSNYNSQQQQQTENDSLSDYDLMIRNQSETGQSSLTHEMNFLTQDLPMNDKSKSQFWDPKTMLNNLSIMEEKIHQLQELVRLIIVRSAKSSTDQPIELMNQQKQLVTADLTSIIIQLISTAGTLLPSVKTPQVSVNPSMGTGFDVSGNNNNNNNNNSNNNNMVNKVEDLSNETDHMDVHEEHESKDEDDVDEGENLPPGSYEILQLEKDEILAPHTHFCLICGKGFKRDANLRMHMRGHGDEYKTPAALAKPHKDIGLEPKLIKRYSCPFVGCKRNKDHKKFQPLKTILCVKNHYKRSHCDKRYTCSRCNTKKFSVIADLKTHEKHCGRDRWLCSCGTTFSRKDKLFGHISLFQGHTPALPVDEPKGGNNNNNNNNDNDDNNNNNNNNNNNIEVGKEGGFFDFNFGSNGSGGLGEPSACFSPLNGFQEFPRGLFEDSENFSFFLQGSGNYAWKNGGESSLKDVQ